MITLFALLGLTGCAQVYDDTKGWGNDVEAWFRSDVIKPIRAKIHGEEELHDGQMAPALVEAVPAQAPAAVPMNAPAPAQSKPTPQPTVVASTAAKVPVVTSDKPMTDAHAKAPADTSHGGAAHNLYPQTAGKAPHKPSAKNPESATQHKEAKQHSSDHKPAMAVHLSSNKSKEAAMQEWSQLKSAFPKQLSGLELDVERADLGKKGVFFRVLAGPFEDKSAARQICSQLKKKQQYCAVMPAPKAQS
ncbi:SPOR domain-containing protein [Pelagibius sp. Alg239-R121]|uniref:SPOR domain-containing protein n=1 Tax=Pelagibius sp. Alg239-R121 TaxID=2993448 RepID=UPI0024A744C2|nr:SPOR domain-containing protein [Pelagibius sp. Alg239-R121]